MKQAKHLSMIRSFHLADWFTLGNAACGVGALFAVMTYLQNPAVLHLYFACALVALAFVFDIFDGRVARWRQQSSVLGRELDSLADVRDRSDWHNAATKTNRRLTEKVDRIGLSGTI